MTLELKRAMSHLRTCQETLKQWRLTKTPHIEAFYEDAVTAAKAWVKSQKEKR